NPRRRHVSWRERLLQTEHHAHLGFHGPAGGWHSRGSRVWNTGFGGETLRDGLSLRRKHLRRRSRRPRQMGERGSTLPISSEVGEAPLTTRPNSELPGFVASPRLAQDV